MRVTFISKISSEIEQCNGLYQTPTSLESDWTRPGPSATRTMHRAERAQPCYTLPDTRCDTRGYRHTRASYGPPRAIRAANGPGSIRTGHGPAPAAATPAVAPSGGGGSCGGSCGCCCGRLPGRCRGPSRAEPPRRSPTPRRAPRRLPLPCAPSPSRCRRQDPVGRPAGDSMT